MSNVIDEKVVEMRFDNRQFESGVQTTLSTLGKLKQSLNMDDAAKGFDELSNAARKCDMSMLYRSAETVQAKFSALETMAVGALLRIGNQAAATGERVLRSLTIDQVSQGWEKYADKTTAVQTIMSATGKSINEVNASLEKLIWFTDETSYSMTDMTSNIGKFTSQGIDLDVAVTAMEGISTWASLSGGSINEAGRAMYNLSQALGVGAVKLQDWKSIENANMATKEFKEMALEAAAAAGTLNVSYDKAGNAIYKTSKGVEVNAANFSQTLQHGWFTSEALLSVLQKYGDYTNGVYELYNGLADGVDKTTSEVIQDLKDLKGADDQTILNAGYTENQIELVRKLSEEIGSVGQKGFAAAQEAKTFAEVMTSVKEAVSSKWSTTFETIFGNYEEAKVLWTDLANALWDAFASGGDARNALLEDGLRNLGRSDVISYISELTGIAEESVTTLQALGAEAGYTSDAFKEMADSLVNGDEGMASMVTHLLEMRDNGNDVVTYIAGLTGASKDSVTELRKLGMETGYTSEEFKELASALAKGEPVMERTITNLLKANEMNGRELLIASFWNAWEGIGTLISEVKEAFGEIFPATTAQQIYNITKALYAASARLKAFFELSEEGEPLNKTFADIRNTFKGVFAAVDIVKQAVDALWRVISPGVPLVGNLLSNVLGLTGSFGEWIIGLDEAIKENDIFYKGLVKVVDFIKGAITTVLDFGAAAAEWLHLPSLDAAKESIRSFLGVLREHVGAPGLEILHEIFSNLCKRAAQVRDAIIGMKNGIVDSFNQVDRTISGSRVVQFLEGVWTFSMKIAAVIRNVLGKAVDGLINTLKNADFNAIMDFINALAAGGILVTIRKFLNPIEEMKGAVTGSFKSLSDLIEKFKGVGSGITKTLDGVRSCLEAYQMNLKADVIKKIAASVAVLAVSLLVLSTIDSDKVTGSLVAMTMLFAEVMGSMAILGKIKLDKGTMLSASTAMVEIGAAMLILSFAMKNLGSLDSKQLVIGLTGVGVLLAEMAVFLRTVKFDRKASKTATSMILFAAAIKILASAAKDLSELSWEELAKGLVGVGVLLAEVDIFLNTAKFSGKSVLTATGIVVLSGAIKILASACKDFGVMSWGEIAKGLASIGALLLELAAFTKLTGNAKHVISTGLALIEIGAAMKIFASAMRDFSGFSWEGIAKGLVAMGGALAEITIAVNLMPKNMVGIGLGLITVGAALKIVTGVLGTMGGMSWEEIAKSLMTLGGALAELSIALNLMNGTLGGSASLVVAAGALAVLTPVLLILGAMSWGSIAKGLIVIAGAFTILGVAGTVLAPMVKTILGLSAAFAIMGVGTVAIGAGLTAISIGITSLAAALGAGVTIIVAGLSSIVLGIAGLIPAIAKKIGEAIVAFCGIIAQGAPAIAGAIKAVALSLIDMLITCIPAIADGALQLVVGLLAALSNYIPQIVDFAMQFLISIFEGIARNMPQLIQAAMGVIGAFFSGVLTALGDIDIDTLIKQIGALGLLTGLMAALGLIAGMIPSAMVGVLGLGVIITELAVVLAAVGALAQIPGLEWLIGEGGRLLELIGNAIGGFVGGIVGGFMTGISGSFPQIGLDLSAFMTNVQPFIDGASSISPDLLSGIATLTGAILLITATDVLESLTSWLTGGSSLSDFGEELVPFGKSMAKFSEAIKDLKPDLVDKAATAGKTLAEMARALPKQGGFTGLFNGGTDIVSFSEQLEPFGKNMVRFSDSLKGLDAETVDKAATAGRALAEMAKTLPNSGGLIGFFTGNNDMDTFGKQLVSFGGSMKDFSVSVADLDDAALKSIQNGATAGSTMAEMAKTLPNSGGLISFFTGGNDMDAFGEQLKPFGEAIVGFADTVKDLDSESVEKAAAAGTMMAELAKTLPNSGGLVGFFTGENDLFTFANQLVPFGNAITKFSDAVKDVDVASAAKAAAAGSIMAALGKSLPDGRGVVGFFTGKNDLASFGGQLALFGSSMKSFADSVKNMDESGVEKAAAAGSMMAALAETIPDTKGIAGFFTGWNDLASFGTQISSFGSGMKSFAEAVSGIENTNAIENAITAGSMMAEMAKTLPDTGGVISFFTGGANMAIFGRQLGPFGEGMKNFADTVRELDTRGVEKAATAGSMMAEMAKTLPSTGGVVSFFTGGTDMAAFGKQLEPFGNGMKSLAEAVSGIENTDAIENAAIAGKMMAEMAKTLPSSGGVVSFFTGGADMAEFGRQLEPFGKGMKRFADKVSGITDVSAIENAATAGKMMAEMAKTLPNSGGVISFFTGGADMAEFGRQIEIFGEGLVKYYNNVADLRPDIMTSSIQAARALIQIANQCNDLDTIGLYSLGTAFGNMASTGLTEFTNAFTGAEETVISTITAVISAANTAIEERGVELKTTFRSVMLSCIALIRDYYTPFLNAGKYIMQGLAAGIDENTSVAVEAAGRMAGELRKKTEEVLSIHSPSRVFMELGGYLATGLALGIRNNTPEAANAAAEMAELILKRERDVLGIHSPSDETESDGQNLVQGLVGGIQDKLPDGLSAVGDFGGQILGGLKDSLNITGEGDSASSAVTENLGSALSESLASGITANMAPEEAAKRKADNIVNIFKDALEALNLDMTTADLEYQLWEKTAGYGASDAEKAAQELALKQSKLSLQANRAELARKEYELTLSELGSSSEETQKAYNKLLQEQIALADLQNQINETQAAAAQANREALIEHSRFINENADALLAMGFSMEEIKAEASRVSGWKPSGSPAEKVVTSTVTTLQNGSVQAGQAGTSMVVSFADQVENGVPVAEQAGEDLGVGGVDGTMSTDPMWGEAGVSLVETFAENVEAATPLAEAAGANMGAAAAAAAANAFSGFGASATKTVSKALRDKLPSDGSAVYLPDGTLLDHDIILGNGFVVGAGYFSEMNLDRRGITNMYDLVKWWEKQGWDREDLLKQINSTTLSSFETISSMSDLQKRSSTLIDADDDTRMLRNLRGLSADTVSVTLPSSINDAIRDISANVDTARAKFAGQDGSGGSSSNTYNFTQNNYSPVALSQTEIYRQTKNMLQSVKK